MKSGIIDPKLAEEIVKGEKTLDNNKGMEIAIVGCQEAGKTNGLAMIALNRMHPPTNDIIIWRGSKDCQWSYFLNQNEREMVFWIKDGREFEVIDRGNEKIRELEEFGSVRSWSNYRTLIDEKIRNNKINVVYTAAKANRQQFIQDWKRIFTGLNNRIYKRYVTVLFDEFADFVPQQGLAGGSWHLVAGKTDENEEGIDEIIRAARKNRILYFFVIHNWGDIYYAVSKKIRNKIWMKASNPGSVRDSIISSNMKEVETGEGWIETPKGSYDGFKFDFLGEEKNLRLRPPSPTN